MCLQINAQFEMRLLVLSNVFIVTLIDECRVGFLIKKSKKQKTTLVFCKADLRNSECMKFIAV